MEDDYDGDDWGEILYEETTKNLESRNYLKRRFGYYCILLGILDLTVGTGIFILWKRTNTLNALSITIAQGLFAIFFISGIFLFVIARIKLSEKAKITVIVEKGIVRGEFKHFDNIPMVEVRGPNEKTMRLWGKAKGIGSTQVASRSGKNIPAFVLLSTQEVDYHGFIKALKSTGYYHEGDGSLMGNADGPGPDDDTAGKHDDPDRNMKGIIDSPKE